MSQPDQRRGEGARGDGEPDVVCAAPTCRRAPSRGLLCAADADQLGQWLADFAADWRQLDATPTSATSGGGRGGGLASHRAPARLDVLVLTDPRSRPRDDADPDGNGARSLPEVLGSWASTVREDMGTPGTERYDVQADRAFLAAALSRWIVHRDYVDELFIDVRDVWAQLKAATGQSAGPRPVRACPTLAGQPAARCNGPVWLDKDAAWCGHCGTAWSGFQLVRLLREKAA
ncbi:hypothetical protein QOZ88_05870 [Blastococcus sp. BMG 814]|uniref:Uncharacterized protein n=1 Tax=Blastococcus carthaginiensis TaxID=3050034 RepID=A0ABT9IA94_9ACTN|nr:hypothetical protein [Blastococcus carthaginiensis]MDP5182157.1 hypothetical protein [Blastococcus carthaginiensis]